MALNVDSLIARLMQQSSEVPPVLDQEAVTQGKIKPPVKVRMREEEIVALCAASRELFLSQPVLLELRAPITICGDIHGQYYDLLRIFQVAGHPEDTNYLFLGDYVDRGMYSLETICLLLAFRLKHPDRFFLLRGNHESASITRMYGFYDECKRRFSVKLWKTFCDCFNCLPVAAVVDKRIFCCHGGLSPYMRSLEQINRIARPTDVPDTGLMCDLLWADPHDEIENWGESARGVSHTFGKKKVTEFLDKFDMDLVVRAHEVMEDGYQFFAGRKLVTVFSAPNYCLTEEMQLLTNLGWLSLLEFRGVVQDVLVAGFDGTKVVYERPCGFIDNYPDAKGQMIEFTSTYDHRFRVQVTPNHRMLIKTEQEYTKIEADQMALPVVIPCVENDTMLVDTTCDKKQLVPYAKHTWCVTMRCGTIVTRWTDGKNTSLPTIMGNCGDWDNAGGILKVSDKLVCSFEILKPAEKHKIEAAAAAASEEKK